MSRCHVVDAGHSHLPVAADAAKAVFESTSVMRTPSSQRQAGREGIRDFRKAVNVALSPIGALVWEYEKIRDWPVPALEPRLAILSRQHRHSPTHDCRPGDRAAQVCQPRDRSETFTRTSSLQPYPAFVRIVEQLTPTRQSFSRISLVCLYTSWRASICARTFSLCSPIGVAGLF